MLSLSITSTIMCLCMAELLPEQFLSFIVHCNLLHENAKTCYTTNAFVFRRFDRRCYVDS